MVAANLSADSQLKLVGLVWGLAATRRSVCIHQMNSHNDYVMMTAWHTHCHSYYYYYYSNSALLCLGTSRFLVNLASFTSHCHIWPNVPRVSVHTATELMQSLQQWKYWLHIAQYTVYDMREYDRKCILTFNVMHPSLNSSSSSVNLQSHSADPSLITHQSQIDLLQLWTQCVILITDMNVGI